MVSFHQDVTTAPISAGRKTRKSQPDVGSTTQMVGRTDARGPFLQYPRKRPSQDNIRKITFYLLLTASCALVMGSSDTDGSNEFGDAHFGLAKETEQELYALPGVKTISKLVTKARSKLFSLTSPSSQRNIHVSTNDPQNESDQSDGRESPTPANATPKGFKPLDNCIAEFANKPNVIEKKHNSAPIEGDRIEVNYRSCGKWFTATYRGPDPKHRSDFIGVEYDDTPGKILGARNTPEVVRWLVPQTSERKPDVGSDTQTEPEQPDHNSCRSCVGTGKVLQGTIRCEACKGRGRRKGGARTQDEPNSPKENKSMKVAESNAEEPEESGSLTHANAKGAKPFGKCTTISSYVAAEKQLRKIVSDAESARKASLGAKPASATIELLRNAKDFIVERKELKVPLNSCGTQRVKGCKPLDKRTTMALSCYDDAESKLREMASDAAKASLSAKLASAIIKSGSPQGVSSPTGRSAGAPATPDSTQVLSSPMLPKQPTAGSTPREVSSDASEMSWTPIEEEPDCVMVGGMIDGNTTSSLKDTDQQLSHH